MKKTKTSLSAMAVAGALVVTGVAAAPQASASPQRQRIAHTAPAWVAHAHSLGAAAAGGTSTFRVYLSPRGGTRALDATVDAVSDPASPGYRHFLGAAAYHARFDAPGSTVRTVSSWLRQHGLSVTAVDGHHRFLAVRGANAAVEQALGVRLHRFRHLGQSVQANTDAVSVPASVAPFITTVAGLDTTVRRLTHDVKLPAGFRNARPCSAFYGEKPATVRADGTTPLPTFQGRTLPYAVCGYTGPQLRGAYEGSSATGLTGGRGVTVAVIDAYAAPTIASDAATYARRNGDAPYARGQLTQVPPRTFTHSGTGRAGCDATGWYGEETLDVEAVHAMAGGANIRYYAASSCYDDDFLAAQAKVVDENKASIVTNSYGEPDSVADPANLAAEQEIFKQGAIQGISWVFSSGDSGDELADTGIKQTDSSASDPYVTAVGGTSDAIGADRHFLFQTGWGTRKYALSADGASWSPLGFIYGAGGGVSTLYPQPAYQKAVVPARFSGGRAVPDIAMDADPTTGMLVGETQKFPDGKYYSEYRIGGTSLASPLFAGMTALRSQRAGSRLGFLNPLIYSQAGTSVLTDIAGTPPDPGNVRVDYVNGVDASDGLTYSVRTFNQDSSLETTPGWDEVTGVGSPNAGWLTPVATLRARTTLSRARS